MNYDFILEKLQKSNFRSKFHLKDTDKAYIKRVGVDKIREHAYSFIEKRLAIYPTIHDGKQTPYKGHPVFIAEHGTATCCRGCLYKWYHIPKDRALTKKEVDYIVGLIMKWIEKELI